MKRACLVLAACLAAACLVSGPPARGDSMREIVVVDRSTSPFPGYDAFLSAMQKYADTLAAGGYEQVRLVPAKDLPGPGVERLVIWDDVDQPGAVAYHDDPAGTPTGHTFRVTAARAGLPFGLPFTHELAEQVRDRAVNRIAISGKGNLVGEEIADAVEDPRYAFKVGDYVVSDFVLPSYFEPGAKGPYDYGGHVSRPFEILPGGYLPIYDGRAGRWTTLHASLEDERAFHAGLHRDSRAWKRLSRSPGGGNVAA